jgi:hypothetical protein
MHRRRGSVQLAIEVKFHFPESDSLRVRRGARTGAELSPWAGIGGAMVDGRIGEIKNPGEPLNAGGPDKCYRVVPSGDQPSVEKPVPIADSFIRSLSERTR